VEKHKGLGGTFVQFYKVSSKEIAPKALFL